MSRYCTNCGAEISSKSVLCPKCGHSVKKLAMANDESNIGWRILGVFIPIVGFILYLIWKNDRPKVANDLGFGALIGMALYVQFVILYFLTIFAVLLIAFLSLYFY